MRYQRMRQTGHLLGLRGWSRQAVPPRGAAPRCLAGSFQVVTPLSPAETLGSYFTTLTLSRSCWKGKQLFLSLLIFPSRVSPGGAEQPLRGAGTKVPVVLFWHSSDHGESNSSERKMKVSSLLLPLRFTPPFRQVLPTTSNQ